MTNSFTEVEFARATTGYKLSGGMYETNVTTGGGWGHDATFSVSNSTYRTAGVVALFKAKPIP